MTVPLQELTDCMLKVRNSCFTDYVIAASTIGTALNGYLIDELKW